MKKIVLTTVAIKVIAVAVIMFAGSNFAFSQKYGYIDSDYILSNMDEYISATEEIDKLSVEWQKELEEKFAKVDKMYQQYTVEAAMLPKDKRLQKENEITKAEQEAKELQKQRFGQDGDLYKKREELVKPIQDKIFAAIEEYAKEKNYAFVFDVAGSLTIVYANDKFDINDEIMNKLGIVVKSK